MRVWCGRPWRKRAIDEAPQASKAFFRIGCFRPALDTIHDSSASAAVRARLEVGSNGLTPGQVRRLKRACGDAFVLTVDDAEIAESEALLFEWNDCVLS